MVLNPSIPGGFQEKPIGMQPGHDRSSDDDENQISETLRNHREMLRELKKKYRVSAKMLRRVRKRDLLVHQIQQHTLHDFLNDTLTSCSESLYSESLYSALDQLSVATPNLSVLVPQTPNKKQGSIASHSPSFSPSDSPSFYSSFSPSVSSSLPNAIEESPSTEKTYSWKKESDARTEGEYQDEDFARLFHRDRQPHQRASRQKALASVCEESELRVDGDVFFDSLEVESEDEAEFVDKFVDCVPVSDGAIAPAKIQVSEEHGLQSNVDSNDSVSQPSAIPLDLQQSKKNIGALPKEKDEHLIDLKIDKDNASDVFVGSFSDCQSSERDAEEQLFRNHMKNISSIEEIKGDMGGHFIDTSSEAQFPGKGKGNDQSMDFVRSSSNEITNNISKNQSPLKLNILSPSKTTETEKVVIHEESGSTCDEHVINSVIVDQKDISSASNQALERKTNESNTVNLDLLAEKDKQQIDNILDNFFEEFNAMDSDNSTEVPETKCLENSKNDCDVPEDPVTHENESKDAKREDAQIAEVENHEELIAEPIGDFDQNPISISMFLKEEGNQDLVLGPVQVDDDVGVNNDMEVPSPIKNEVNAIDDMLDDFLRAMAEPDDAVGDIDNDLNCTEDFIFPSPEKVSIEGLKRANRDSSPTDWQESQCNTQDSGLDVGKSTEGAFAVDNVENDVSSTPDLDIVPELDVGNGIKQNDHSGLLSNDVITTEEKIEYVDSVAGKMVESKSSPKLDLEDITKCDLPEGSISATSLLHTDVSSMEQSSIQNSTPLGDNKPAPDISAEKEFQSMEKTENESELARSSVHNELTNAKSNDDIPPPSLTLADESRSRITSPELSQSLVENPDIFLSNSFEIDSTRPIDPVATALSQDSSQGKQDHDDFSRANEAINSITFSEARHEDKTESMNPLTDSSSRALLLEGLTHLAESIIRNDSNTMHIGNASAEAISSETATQPVCDEFERPNNPTGATLRDDSSKDEIYFTEKSIECFSNEYFANNSNEAITPVVSPRVTRNQTATNQGSEFVNKSNQDIASVASGQEIVNKSNEDIKSTVIRDQSTTNGSIDVVNKSNERIVSVAPNQEVINKCNEDINSTAIRHQSTTNGSSDVVDRSNERIVSVAPNQEVVNKNKETIASNAFMRDQSTTNSSSDVVNKSNEVIAPMIPPQATTKDQSTEDDGGEVINKSNEAIAPVVSPQATNHQSTDDEGGSVANKSNEVITPVVSPQATEDQSNINEDDEVTTYKTATSGSRLFKTASVSTISASSIQSFKSETINVDASASAREVPDKNNEPQEQDRSFISIATPPPIPKKESNLTEILGTSGSKPPRKPRSATPTTSESAKMPFLRTSERLSEGSPSRKFRARTRAERSPHRVETSRSPLFFDRGEDRSSTGDSSVRWYTSPARSRSPANSRRLQNGNCSVSSSPGSARKHGRSVLQNSNRTISTPRGSKNDQPSFMSETQSSISRKKENMRSPARSEITQSTMVTYASPNRSMMASMKSPLRGFHSLASPPRSPAMCLYSRMPKGARCAMRRIQKKNGCDDNPNDDLLSVDTVRMCSNKFAYKIHPKMGPCDRCWALASEEEREIFNQRGSHLRIAKTRSGCQRSCAIFPSEGASGTPVRLCRPCFFATHQQVDGSCRLQLYKGKPMKARQSR